MAQMDVEPCEHCGVLRIVGSSCVNCGTKARRPLLWLLAGVVVAGSLAGYAWHQHGANEAEAEVPYEDHIQWVSLTESKPPAPDDFKDSASAPAPAPGPLFPPVASQPAPAGDIGSAGAPPLEPLPNTLAETPSEMPPPPEGTPGLAAAARPPVTLGIDVKEVGTAKGIDTNWIRPWGSYSKDYYRTKALELNVSNVSRQPVQGLKAEVYWLGKKLSNGQLHVAHGEVMPFDVERNASVQRRFWCPVMFSNVTKYVLLGRTETGGSKFFGWVVLVTRDGKVLAGRGSGAEANNMIREGTQLAKMVADYVPDGRQATTEMPHWRDDPARRSKPQTGGGSSTP